MDRAKRQGRALGVHGRPTGQRCGGLGPRWQRPSTRALSLRQAVARLGVGVGTVQRMIHRVP